MHRAHACGGVSIFGASCCELVQRHVAGTVAPGEFAVYDSNSCRGTHGQGRVLGQTVGVCQHGTGVSENLQSCVLYNDALHYLLAHEFPWTRGHETDYQSDLKRDRGPNTVCDYCAAIHPLAQMLFSMLFTTDRA